MIYILYSTETFKDTILSFIELRKIIPINDIKTVDITRLKKQGISIDQIIMELLDKASGFILEFSSRNKKNTLLLYMSLKLAGLPGIVASRSFSSPANKALATTIKNYVSLENRGLLQESIAKIYSNSKNISAPEKLLKSKGGLITVTFPQKATIFYTYPKNIDKHKPNLIFTHGITARAVTYAKLLTILQKYYNIFTLDLPYHGRSSQLGKYPHTLNEYAQIVSTAIKQIIIKQQLHKSNKGLHLMGHSLGGAVMFYTAFHLQNKYNIQHLYLLNPAGGPIKQNRTKLVYLTTAYKLLNINKYYVLNSDLKRIIMEVLMNHLKNLNAKTPKMVKEFSRIIPKGFVNFDKMIIDVPTTLIFSDKDAYFSCDYRYSFAQHFNNLKLTELPGSHDWPVIHPELIKPLLKQKTSHEQSPIQFIRNFIKGIFQ